MRRLGLMAMFLFFGCGAPNQGEEGNPLEGCTGSDVPIYSSRFAPQAGGSGVATPADALAGKTNSESSGSAPSECDNGQYDQHTINDIVVCIPC